MEQGDDLMATTASGDQVPIKHPNPDHNDVIIIVVVVVVVVLVPIMYKCCHNKIPHVAPLEETRHSETPRFPGCGESRDSNRGDGFSYDIPAPNQSPSPSPHLVI